MIDEKNSRLQEGVVQATAGAQRHANDVTGIVMSMQFQDISQQRLEKAIQILHQLQEEFSKGVLAESHVDVAERLGNLDNREDRVGVPDLSSQGAGR